MTDLPLFPPLMKGLATGPANPFPVAVARARAGTDAGLLAWSVTEERLRAAIVLAPDVPLEVAMAAFPACAVGVQNALGALSPPETAVHLEWTGGIRLNGGHAGGLHVASATRDPKAVPDWLVVALDLTLRLPDEMEPGATPDWTALDQEGCGEIPASHLLEAYSRHALIWINALDESKGRADLHREWQGLAWKIKEGISLPVDGAHLTGTFLGTDENFGMLFKSGDQTRLIPLSTLIEDV